jgi:hypothetical protein
VPSLAAVVHLLRCVALSGGGKHLGEPVFFSVFFIFLVKKSKITGQKYNFCRIDTEFLTKMVV